MNPAKKTGIIVNFITFIPYLQNILLLTFLKIELVF